MPNIPTFTKDENGNKYWYLNDKLHREDGPAIEFADGDKFWFLNGKQHREDGPAAEYANGDKHWFLNGKQHREDGPAADRADGYKFWYLNGKMLSFEDWCKRTNITEKEKFELMMKYA